MKYSLLSVLSNTFLSVFCGWMCIVLVRKFLRYQKADSVAQAERMARFWPMPFARLAKPISFLIPPTERFIRPSAQISRELKIIEQSPEFNDLEFLKMRHVCAVFAGVVGLIILLAMSVFGLSVSGSAAVLLPFALGIGGFVLPRVILRDQSNAALRRIQRAFPNFLDVFALTLESGRNFQSALVLSVQHLSDPANQPGLKTQLQEVLRSVRSGQSRMQALKQLSEHLALPEVVQFVASVAASEQQGVSVTALLRRQSEQLRVSRALAAERHAMKLPVKLLAPLAICIFPCTFLVLAFPIGVQLSRSGIF
jgi:tight adherence protein C